MRKRRFIAVGCLVAGVLVAIGILLPTTVAVRSRFTCILCRQERVDHRFLGIEWNDMHETEFTEWYRIHRPAHSHDWRRAGCMVGKNIFGKPTFFACPILHPVCSIPTDSLKDFAEHADTNTLDAFFSGVISTNRDMQEKAIELVYEKIFRAGDTK